MIDIDYLKRIKLVSNPFWQKFVAQFLLLPNYHFFAKVDIRIENSERIPRGENVIFAMNHTDRFNYWPFQYKLWQMREFPFTTVWVKAKYYKNAFLAKGLDLCNLIPVPSMGYLIEEFYRKRFDRKMDKGLYRIIKDMIDGRIEAAGPQERAALEALQAMGDQFAEFIRGQYEAIMAKVAELSRLGALREESEPYHLSRGNPLLDAGRGEDRARAACPPHGKADRPRGLQQLRGGLHREPPHRPERLDHLPHRRAPLGLRSAQGLPHRRALHPLFPGVAAALPGAVRGGDAGRHGEDRGDARREVPPGMRRQR